MNVNRPSEWNKRTEQATSIFQELLVVWLEGVVPMERFLGALSLTLLLTGLVAAAQVQSSPPNPVEQVVEAGLMTRFSDGNFRGDEAVSRAELARILVKTFHLDQRHTNPMFVVPVEDVPPSHWAYEDIQLVLRNRIMTGYRQGRFYPAQRVTRAEAFAIFAQAYGVFQFPEQTIEEVLSPYPDSPKIPDWARKSIATAVYEGFVNLKDHGRLDPLSPMTREDMAYAINSYLMQQRTPIQSLWQMIQLAKS
jgi:hypothetical protein